MLGYCRPPPPPPPPPEAAYSACIQYHNIIIMQKSCSPPRKKFCKTLACVQCQVHVYVPVLFFTSVCAIFNIFLLSPSLSLGTALLSSLRLFLRRYLLPPDGAALSASSALREPLWRPLAPPSQTTPPLLVCSLPPERGEGAEPKSPLQTSSPSLPRKVNCPKL